MIPLNDRRVAAEVREKDHHDCALSVKQVNRAIGANTVGSGGSRFDDRDGARWETGFDGGIKP